MAGPLSAEELMALSETHVAVRLTPEQLLPALSHAPFVDVEGTFNVRDIGRIPRPGGAASPARLRPGLAFRSGMLGHLTAKGKATIAEGLGVRSIFDLRSQAEHAAAPDPQPAPGVAMVWLETSEATPDVDLAPFVEGAGEAGFIKVYLDVLSVYAPTLRTLLEHVRDRPGEPFLFHCTAGRDRTGVTAGLLLTLAGEPAEVIALDYMLSRIGSEPVRDQLEKFARSGAGVSKTTAAAAGAGDATNMTADVNALPPGFVNLISLRVQCWSAFLDALQAKYGSGGFEGYVKTALGFSDSDVATIKTNLTTAPA